MNRSPDFRGINYAPAFLENQLLYVGRNQGGVVCHTLSYQLGSPSRNALSKKAVS
jgi:hypothetical protein